MGLDTSPTSSHNDENPTRREGRDRRCVEETKLADEEDIRNREKIEEFKRMRMEKREMRRLRRLQNDWPLLRRILGMLVIVGVLLYGWKSLDRRAEQERKRLAELGLLSSPQPTPIPGEDDWTQPPPELRDRIPEQVAEVPISKEARQIISQCTQGDDAFRLLDLKSELVTMESAWAAVLPLELAQQKASRIRRQLSLVNVSIRRSGEEWRLQAAPEGERGVLKPKLFKVNPRDRLPEVMPFPKGLQSLEGVEITAEGLELFQSQGEMIEEELHERWSFASGAGVQILRRNGLIFDLQAYPKGSFLACSRRDSGEIQCTCLARP